MSNWSSWSRRGSSKNFSSVPVVICSTQPPYASLAHVLRLHIATKIPAHEALSMSRLLCDGEGFFPTVYSKKVVHHFPTFSYKNIESQSSTQSYFIARDR